MKKQFKTAQDVVDYFDTKELDLRNNYLEELQDLQVEFKYSLHKLYIKKTDALAAFPNFTESDKDI